MDAQLNGLATATRVCRSQWNHINKLQLAAYVIQAKDLDFLYDGLAREQIKVVRAAFEADVHLAKHFAVVVSADSDFYSHQGIKTFAKFKFNNHSRAILVVPMVLDVVKERLKLKYKPNGLQLLGIVTRNDYSDFRPRIGWKKNLDWIRKTADPTLASYCHAFNLTMASFAHSNRIFTERQETALGENDAQRYQGAGIHFGFFISF